MNDTVKQLVKDSVIILTSPTGERGYRKVQERLQQGQSRKQEAKVKSRVGLSRGESRRG